jgi:adenylate cyclase
MSSKRQRLGEWFSYLGVDADDAEDLRLKKVQLVSSSAMLSGAAVLWGLMYLALGRPVSAAIPLGYSILSVISIWIFARRRHFRRFRTSQLALQLLLPFLLMLSLGGMIGSGGVVVWSVLCPLGALVFASDSEARLWFAAFIGVLAASLALDPVVNDMELLSETTIVFFGVMNIAGVSTIIFVLLQYFTVQRDAAQATSEALLLNILPGSIARALKQGPPGPSPSTTTVSACSSPT